MCSVAVCFIQSFVYDKFRKIILLKIMKLGSNKKAIYLTPKIMKIVHILNIDRLCLKHLFIYNLGGVLTRVSNDVSFPMHRK